MPGKFIVGRYLDIPAHGFDNNPTPLPAPGAPDHFVSVPALSYEIMESSGILTKRSQVAAGHNAIKTHRNFRWLPWIPGKVSYVPLAGDDVFTGPFTGCWVSIFDMGGVQHVGHIGTETDSTTANTRQVRAAWKSAVDGNQIRSIRAFEPTTGVPMRFDGAPTYYALITSAGDMYSVVLTKPFKGGNPLKQKIEVVSLATPVAAPPF